MQTSRREFMQVVAAAAAAGAIPGAGLAAIDPLVLSWPDLIPPTADNADTVVQALRGVVPHGGITQQAPSNQPIEDQLRQDLNGSVVKLPGYSLPLEMNDVGVTEFLLVPYVGACIHVPPPPANQMVWVQMSEPIIFKSLLEAVWVTGVFDATPVQLGQLLEAGYTLSANEISPYIFKE